MENLSKALMLSAYALLFVFAISISIFLYNTLLTYVNTATLSTNIQYRAEQATTGSVENRVIDVNEIYLTLNNMKQMHVDYIVVDTQKKVSSKEAEQKQNVYYDLMYYLYNIQNKKFSYDVSYDGSTTTVTYKSK